MGLFNFIETFFFISLAITFILILLLVYHFKQRIGSLEQKCDTMFEIINDMVRQISMIKEIALRPVPNVPTNYLNHRPNIEFTMPIEISHANISNLTQQVESYDRVNVSEEDSDDDESSAIGESDESESDEEDLDEGIPPLEDINFELTAETESVKIINVPIHEQIDVSEQVEDLDENATTADLNVEAFEVEEIHVEKKETEESEEGLDETHGPERESNKEIYQKMNLNTLKTLVISKGLISDASKMKKADLIKLLENSEEN